MPYFFVKPPPAFVCHNVVICDQEAPWWWNHDKIQRTTARLNRFLNAQDPRIGVLGLLVIRMPWRFCKLDAFSRNASLWTSLWNHVPVRLLLIVLYPLARLHERYLHCVSVLFLPCPHLIVYDCQLAKHLIFPVKFFKHVVTWAIVSFPTFFFFFSHNWRCTVVNEKRSTTMLSLTNTYQA